jgi:predicted NUDIX family NTP pyrophosphohydrolase
MSVQVSAGLIMYRFHGSELQVFLAHPGGPYADSKDEGFWTIPKGRQKRYERLFDAAKREFEEEVGIQPHGPYFELGSIRQRSGKIVHAWAFQGDWDDTQPIRSHTFDLAWPPRSGQTQAFPEIDEARFFALPEARRKLKSSQAPFLGRLVAMLRMRPLHREPAEAATVNSAA